MKTMKYEHTTTSPNLSYYSITLESACIIISYYFEPMSIIISNHCAFVRLVCMNANSLYGPVYR